MNEKESKYIRNFRFIAALTSGLLIVLIMTAWVRESWRSEWRQVQKEYYSLLDTVNKPGNQQASAANLHIEQLNLTDLHRTDRCVTCHLGIENQLMTGVPQPHRFHPGDHLVNHPLQQYGCTVCHGGQGRAITRREAFGQDEDLHWDMPLLEHPYIQSSCGKCHATIFSELGRLNGTGIFMQGAAIFNREGCLGCHRARGVGGTVGPDLTRQGEKTKHEYSFQNIRGEQTISNWLKEHFRDPEMVSPGSQMLKVDLDENELEALVTFVMGLASPDIPFSYLSVQTLNEFKGVRDQLNGEKTFDFCCSACHGKDGEGKDYETYATGIPAIGNRDFLSTASHEFIAFTLDKGRSKRQMASWSTRYSGLSANELDSLVRHLRLRYDINASYDGVRSTKGNPESGRQLFDLNCSMCHGQDGEGDVALALNNPGFLTFAADRFITETLIYGRYHTAMPSWGYLEDQQLADLLTYIRSWGRYQVPAVDVSVKTGDPQEGSLQFHYLCSRCHGAFGEGNTGPAVLNKSFLDVADDTYLYRTITQGRSHTAMFGWATPLTGTEQLDRQSVNDLISYMRSTRDSTWNYIYSGKNPGNRDAGQLVYEANCAECHGAGGAGDQAPALNNQEFLSAASNGFIMATLALGRNDTKMPSWGRASEGYPALTGKERQDVTAYLRSWQRIKIRK